MIGALLLAALLSAEPSPPSTGPAPPPAEAGLSWAPFVQMAGLRFSSAQVAAGGAGGGVGVQAVWRRRWVGQADVGLLWAAGRVGTARLAAGVQRDGRWAPAAWGSLGLLWGERTELLAADGRRPASPNLALGVRASPLRFTGADGFVSALEVGLGLQPGGGTWLEVMLVQAGAWW